MKLPVLSIREVAERQLCSGCGACAYLSPDEIRMVEDVEKGKRPLVEGEERDPRSAEALRACPGASLEHTFDRDDPALRQELIAGWGPVRRVWEGHAGDGAIRWAGSSGGAASALALYCIERGGMSGVLHTAAREDAPFINETVMSRTREELLARTGSRYAPASPCDGLGLVEASEGKCVFVGKPCDVAGAQRARAMRAGLDAKLGVTIAFFCAGAPSARGTLELMKKVGVEDVSAVESVRYRGNGWPGLWRVRWRGSAGEAREASMTYAESWGFLQRYRQWRCYVCPDHTGEFADISVGDPWYREIEEGEGGSSLIVARTALGERIVRAASEAGYIELQREDATLLARSQPNLLGARGAVAGRAWATRVAGVATPSFKGFALWRYWWGELSLKEKLRSTVGTWRRMRRKGLGERSEVREWAVSEKPVGTGVRSG